MRDRSGFAVWIVCGAFALGSVPSAADELLRVEPGSFGADYLRDTSGLIVGSVTPGYGGSLYVRDRNGLIIGTIDDRDATNLLKVEPEQ